MAGATIAQAADYVLHRYFAPRMQEATLKGHPTLDLIKKDPNFKGNLKEVPILITGPHGFGTTVSGAQTNQSNTDGEKFLLTVGNTYMVLDVADKTMEASAGNLGAWMEIRKVEVEQGLRRFGQIASKQLWGNGGGSLGQRGSVASSVLTLSNADDITNFEVGMVIVASDADGSGSSDALRSGSITITDIDYAAGTFTFTGTITSFADTDYLFQQSMFAGAVTSDSLMQGFQAWVPATAPGSTAFFGVDRTTSDRLSGVRIPTAEAIGSNLERIENLCVRMNARYETEPGMIVVNPERWKDISRELQNKSNLEQTKRKSSVGAWGYGMVEHLSPYGPVSIMADKHCPSTAAFALSEEYMQLVSMRSLVSPMNGDGLQMLRKSTSADYELRFRMYANLEINNPAGFGRVALSAS